MFLTDAEYTILHLLRPRTDVNQDVRYAARERFPVELARPIPEVLLNLEGDDGLAKLEQTVTDLLTGATGPWNPHPPKEGIELLPVTTVLNNTLCMFSLLKRIVSPNLKIIVLLQRVELVC